MPTTPMKAKNQLILAKVETAYDTDPTPTAASNSLVALEPKIKEIIDPVRRPTNVGSLSRVASVAGRKMAEVTFNMELKGSGTPGTAPRIGALLRACGFGQTIVSGVSVTYLPASSSLESITLYFYIDGRLHIVTGAVGDVKFKCEAGQMPMAEFTFKGRYADPSLASLPAPTLESTTPQVCKSCAFTYNSRTTLVVKSTELEMNNTVAERTSINDANAIAGFLITDRDPMLTIDPEAIIETSYNFRSDALGGNQRAISWVVGASAGNIVTFSLPKFNPYWPEYDRRDEILVEKIKGEACLSSGNDEVSIIFS